MTDSGIVADGRDRALAGAHEQMTRLSLEIKAAVESEFAGRLAAAGVVRRAYLRLRMRREVQRRIAREIEKKAPRGGLYVKS